MLPVRAALFEGLGPSLICHDGAWNSFPSKRRFHAHCVVANEPSLIVPTGTLFVWLVKQSPHTHKRVDHLAASHDMQPFKHLRKRMSVIVIK